MSASRMPVFSPSAAKPSARLHEVVDLPTPPLPEATAMTCLTPGMPDARDVARALGSVWVADTTVSLRSKAIALLRVEATQMIFLRQHGWPLRRAMRVKTFIAHGFDPAV